MVLLVSVYLSGRETRDRNTPCRASASIGIEEPPTCRARSTYARFTLLRAHLLRLRWNTRSHTL